MNRRCVVTGIITLSLVSVTGQALQNIVLIYADDISARELPVYGSSVWSPPEGGDTSDAAFQATTPVLDRMAEEGCWIKTAWAATICSPSRAMMMTGRYAHLHKWWHNGDLGTVEKGGKRTVWPLNESSPLLIGHVAQQAGYGTYWAGKTQMKNSDLRLFGFDEGAFTPGEAGAKDNPNSDFQIVQKKIDGKNTLINMDSGLPGGLYPVLGYYWKPNVRLMNHPDANSDLVWWPNTAASKAAFGLNTYAPDVELDFIFDFMDRQKEAGKPFFIYHTTHLGHGQFNWFDPEDKSKWVGTPVIHWDGSKYTRTDPNVTGNAGVYETHGTVTESGIHSQINYIDYQVWLYQNKLRELGVEDNTVLIFCADNGTHGYGKGYRDIQKGTHVPLIIYAPGMTKKGEQDVLVSMADMLPTIAELAGVTLPPDYEVNGESLVPFLFTDRATHRKWLYAYRKDDQLIRGTKVLKDGKGNWWDVDSDPEDLISFEQITDWGSVSEAHREEREHLLKILPRFDLHASEHDAPVNQPRMEK